VQQDIVTISQGDRVILDGEKCEELYKLKEGNSVQVEVSRKTERDVNWVKVLREG